MMQLSFGMLSKRAWILSARSKNHHVDMKESLLPVMVTGTLSYGLLGRFSSKEPCECQNLFLVFSRQRLSGYKQFGGNGSVLTFT